MFLPRSPVGAPGRKGTGVSEPCVRYDGPAPPSAVSVTYVRIHRPIFLGFKIAFGMFLFGLLLFAVLLALPIGALGLFGMALKALMFSSKW